MCVYSIYIYKRGETAGDCVGDNQSVANLDLHFAASVLYNIPKVLGAKKKKMDAMILLNQGNLQSTYKCLATRRCTPFSPDCG